MPDAGAPTGQRVVTELKVTAHMMTLDSGLFCIFQPGAGHPADPASGLPGVRVTLPPGAAARNDAVAISTFRPDGWLGGQDDAALIRVSRGPAQLLVTVYQSADGRDPPKLQVLRLHDVPPPLAEGVGAVAAPAPAATPEVTAHIQRRGDVAGRVGEWVGERGSQRWIEGFAVAPQSGIAAEDIEYQAVLGRGWLSPWAEGGQFCGSRGMALPILGLRVRLRGAAAETHDCVVSATFVDGASVGPVANGEPCETESLAPLEAFCIEMRPRAGAAAEPAPATARKPASGKAAAPKRKR